MNYIAIAISVKIIEISHFDQTVQPSYLNTKYQHFLMAVILMARWALIISDDTIGFVPNRRQYMRC